MASKPLKDFRTRLTEIDEILAARDAIAPTNAGRPAKRKGNAVIRSGVVLLSAFFESYVEEMYELAVDKLYAAHPASDRKSLKENTSKKNHNAGLHQINNLFFYVGIPWITNHANFHWKRTPNAKARDHIALMAASRNKIAHGAKHVVSKQSFKCWRINAEKAAIALDGIVASHVKSSLSAAALPW